MSLRMFALSSKKPTTDPAAAPPKPDIIDTTNLKVNNNPAQLGPNPNPPHHARIPEPLANAYRELLGSAAQEKATATAAPETTPKDSKALTPDATKPSITDLTFMRANEANSESSEEEPESPSFHYRPLAG